MIDRIFELHDNLNIVGIDSSLIIYSLKLEDIFMLFVDELHSAGTHTKGCFRPTIPRSSSGFTVAKFALSIIRFEDWLFRFLL